MFEIKSNSRHFVLCKTNAISTRDLASSAAICKKICTYR